MLPKDDDTRRAEASTYRPNRWLGRSGDLDDGDVRYVGLDDLAVGATVGVHGRSMRVVGCDEPTRAYLRARGGARADDDDELPGAGVGRCGAGAASAPYALPTTAPTTAAARHPLPAAEPGHDTRRRGAGALPGGGELEGWRVFPGDDRPGRARGGARPSDTLASAPFSSTTPTAGRCPTAASRWATTSAPASPRSASSRPVATRRPSW